MSGDPVSGATKTAGAEAPGGSHAGATHERGSPHGHPLEPLLKRLTELCEFALNYAQARKDKALVSIRGLLWQLAIACATCVCAIGVLVACMIFALSGLSQIAGRLLGGYPGVGQLVVGGGTIAVVVSLSWIWSLARRRKNSLEAKQRYESRHRSQRIRFGEDVAGRAAS